jgi:hypothetical protein
MLTRGQVRIIRVVKKYPANHTGYFRGFYLMNEASIRRCGINPAWLQEICTRIAAALDITEGVCMVDFMCTGAGLQVIETSVRPGLSTFIPLMQQIYGFTSLSLLARLRQHATPDWAIPEAEGLVVHIIAPGPGLLIRFDTTRAWDLPGVIDVHCYNVAGDILVDSPHDHWGLLLGYVLIRNPQPGSIDELFRSVASAIEVQVHELSA